MLDLLFPPSLARITRDFEKTKTRLINFSRRTSEQSGELRDRANALFVEADVLSATVARADRIAARLTDLTN